MIERNDINDINGTRSTSGTNNADGTSGNLRANLRIGLEVDVVMKQDQTSGKTTRGVVKDILTNSSQHPHGIKVRLTNGQVGRVKNVIQQDD